MRGRRLQAARKRLFQSEPLCRMCKAKGIVTPAVHRDHVQALFKHGHDSDDNVQPLCEPCHAEKSRAERGCKPLVKIGLDGYPVSPSGDGG